MRAAECSTPACLGSHFNWKIPTAFSERLRDRYAAGCISLFSLSVAVFVGGQIGARKSIGIDKKKMKRVFGWFLFLTAAVMVGKSLI